MLNIRIICVGKLKERFFADAADEYIKRLSGYCKLDVVEIPEHVEGGGAKGRGSQVAIALEKERFAVEARIPSSAFCVALCVEGREMDSAGLSLFLSDCAVRGASRLCFVIGGSFGLHGGIKERADVKLSMSKMTFPHNLARVMLLEQLYRAFKIAEGGKYHK